MLPRRRQQPQPRARVAAPQSRGEVFSYHANRSVREGGTAIGRTAQQPPTKRASRINLAKRIPMVLALAAIVVCCITILGLNSNVKVVSITSSNPSAHLFLQNTSIYQQAAEKQFTSSILNGNKLTVGTAGITAALQKQFPELQNVSIVLPLIGHRPVVYIQPANPVLFLTTQGGGVYLLDKSGRALIGGDEAVNQTTKLHLPTVHDGSGVQVAVGQVALPSGDVDFIAQVVGQLQAKVLQITSLDLPAGASELDVRMQGVGYVARFNMQGNAREQAGAFLATKQYLTGQHITPGQYVDVRVPQRAYYK
ncbi:MAG TPA: hypothetical protein VLG11_04385 [Candidatus Saccharimonadales bacterium]|nr:hypothetical protein [Candidatus Saccharimonadales bacterium]